jgi:CHAD domain-containing protein
MALKTVQADHSGTRSVRRVAHGFITKAARRLSRAQLSDKEVHDARKDLQKSRAALRLLRTALGNRTYRRENSTLRDVARTLNTARDAKVLAQALEGLRARGNGLADDHNAVELTHLLQAEQAQVRRELHENGALQIPRSELLEVSDRSSRWPVGKAGWSDLGPAFKRIYRSARRAVPPRQSSPDEAGLHEWRKRTKYLRHALQMLEPMRPAMLSPLLQHARSLSECLGEHHDLALLALKARDFSRGNHLSVAALLDAIERRQHQLTVRARATGAKLYRAKPRELTRRLGRYWNSWHGNDVHH